MNEALVISNLVLWVAVGVLGVAVLALLRQVGLLHERIAPAGALVGRESPRAGEAAPVLEVADWSGSPVRIGGPHAEQRNQLLFFVSPSCPVCKTLLPRMAGICAAEDPELELVVASDGPRAEHEDFVRNHELDRGTYVLSTPLALSFQVGRLPYAVLLDAGGVVRARGLVNTREHVESLFEAMERDAARPAEPGTGDRRVA